MQAIATHSEPIQEDGGEPHYVFDTWEWDGRRWTEEKEAFRKGGSVARGPWSVSRRELLRQKARRDTCDEPRTTGFFLSPRHRANNHERLGA